VEALSKDALIKLAKKPFCESPVDSRLLMMNSCMETVILHGPLHLGDSALKHVCADGNAGFCFTLKEALMNPFQKT
ncbi:Hypothetical predicted protein, partial [Marmota monax]